MAGRLVISLDFELMWGVRDHSNIEQYGARILGAREAIPKMLALFKAYEIHATWATVGLLFAKTRDEMLDFAPRIRAKYANPRLCPYPYISKNVGKNEQADPYHFASSLIDQIAQVPGQEVASHTFSHYYTCEQGADLASFTQDIEAGQRIASARGHTLASIVFPRNQMSAQHIACCEKVGLRAYRGNPTGFVYDSRSGIENTKLVRLLRLVDSVAPIFPENTYARVSSDHGIGNIAASRFLRPYNERLPLYSKMHARHVQKEICRAAQNGKTYHLWWHPHNLGSNTAENLTQLESILKTYREMNSRFGMQSASMIDVLQLASKN